MGKKGGENSRKAAGQARKAETAANKKAAEEAKKAAVEDQEWQKGTKSNAKKEAEAAKKAEQARKKAERDAALAEEEKSLPSRGAPKNAKTAVKKTNRGGGIDQALSKLNRDPTEKQELAADNLDDALEILGGPDDTKVDRHPERRVRAAYAAFEARRLQEMKEDGSGKGKRLNVRKEQIHDEFENSPENPMKGLNVPHNATREEIEEIKRQERERVEARLMVH
ncbi:hypothetical protein F4779DRAFT_559584 [Xylariaceae sp. FL0662B]|nr:hypothetical protein F4779DRAFT_559584 [Xylariaceae sp. FL0662B]